MGRIEGTVEISSVLSSRRPRIRLYGEGGAGSVPPSRAGVDTLAELRNVVLYVQSDRSHPLSVAGADNQRYAMAQEDEQFVPHVLPVVRGATVDFPNHDDVFHNVFSLSSARSFDLGRYPRGASRSVTFNAPGTVQVFCHIHADMSAVILVLDNPFFATPEADGRFVIDSLPPGEYSIVGWHERIKPVVRRVTVTAGATAHVDFNIPLPAGAASADGRE
jgi:plastocyanin